MYTLFVFNMYDEVIVRSSRSMQDGKWSVLKNPKVVTSMTTSYFANEKSEIHA